MRFRFWLWGILARLPRVCPAKAHGLVVDGRPQNPLQDAGCAPCDHGCCWCGKTRPSASTEVAG